MHNVETLRAEIQARFGTVYRFCKCSELNKSTVYMVLSGTYPGNTEQQTARIRAVLDGELDQAEAVFRAIKTVACRRCTRQGLCSLCDQLFRDQAAAVIQLNSQDR